MRGGKIRTVLRFAVVAQVRFYTKRGPSTGYRFLGFGPLQASLTGLFQEADPRQQRRNPVALAQEWQHLLDTGQVPSRAALARELGVSRAHVSQVLGVLKVSPEEQQLILKLGYPIEGNGVGIHTLRRKALPGRPVAS